MLESGLLATLAFSFNLPVMPGSRALSQSYLHILPLGRVSQYTSSFVRLIRFAIPRLIGDFLVINISRAITLSAALHCGST